MPKNTSKIISGEDLGAQRWDAPDVTDNNPSGGGSRNMVNSAPTVKEIEQIHDQAYQEGFAQGNKEGKETGKKEIQSQVQRLVDIVNALNKPLEEMDDDVVDELVTLSLTIAQHIIRREIKTDPGEIVAVVRDALSKLPVASRNIVLFLHPDDAAIVKETLSVADEAPSWKISEDPAIERGGCRVVTDTSLVDATVEKRMAAIVAELMGGEREDDN